LHFVHGPEGEDIRQDLQEDRRVSNQKVNSRAFDWATGSECLDIMEGSAPSETKEETSKAQPLEKKKWRYVCSLFETKSRKEGAVWHVDLLLDNDLEITNIQQPLLSNGFANKRVSTAIIGYSNRGTVFSVRSVPRC
jgi:hypothetical protein